MRIFMFSGLAGAELNRRYPEHLRSIPLEPMRGEIRRAAPGGNGLAREDIWPLHGGIVYIGIRKHIYQVPAPDDPRTEIGAGIGGFLRAFEIA